MMLEPSGLFLRRIQQLENFANSSDEFDLVDAAGCLRQLLFDRISLAEAVKGDDEVLFRVGDFRPEWSPEGDPFWEHVEYQCLGDAIDPETSSSDIVVQLTLNELGQHVHAYSKGQKITVLDTVKYNANKMGGRHWDPRPVQKFDKLRVLETLYVGGVAAPRKELQALGRVVLRGLRPTIDRLRAKDDIRST